MKARSPPHLTEHEDLPDRSHGMSGAEVELLCRRARWTEREGGGGFLESRLDQLVADVRPRSAAATVGFLRGADE